MATGSRAGALVTVSSVGVDELRSFAGSLFDEHAAELEPHMGKPQPNWHGYYQLEERGMLLALGAWGRIPPPSEDYRAEDLLGYAVGFMISDLHYNVNLCQHDVLYVRPSARKAGVGRLLMDEFEQCAMMHGADHILMHAKPETALEALLPRRGYRREEVIYRKELVCQQP